ncbi:GTP pyrophosphokinase [Kurthia sp. 3B1D]|uniref:GTP pyrophosphokinase n=2 Tax=Kurthia TaxID=1649 RepID=A0A433RVM0_9BACL|nr:MULTISPECIES: GTP pyrophosphokinase family protein [unclassified Kurthia]RUS57309.1 GTP pyrophosphokinase [Kurthia sp. 3B1D]
MVRIQTEQREQMRQFRVEMTRFMMAYKFALDEMDTKVRILKEEFQLMHEYNPIEHVNTRLKSPESILKKVAKRNLPYTLDAIKESLTDIAGIRIICSFVSDIYRLKEMFERQSDLEIVEVKDYIAHPKENGYQSLHMILKVPVFLSDREEHVCVELQIRTIAMDFWASLEHKIYYKYNKQIPKRLTDELKEAAIAAAQLDYKMESLNQEINILKQQDHANEEPISSNGEALKILSALKQIGLYEQA